MISDETRRAAIRALGQVRFDTGDGAPGEVQASVAEYFGETELDQIISAVAGALASEVEHLLIPVIGWLRFGPLTDSQRQAAVDKLAAVVRLVNPDAFQGHDLTIASTAARCCPHPASEHTHDGCMHGWGNPNKPRVGCGCLSPGLADGGGRTSCRA